MPEKQSPWILQLVGSQANDWEIRTVLDPALEEELTDHLVAYNQSRSAEVRERFQPGNLASEPVQAFAIDDNGELLGGCSGRVERVWHWLNIDTMWVHESRRGQGIGLALLEVVEAEGVRRGCRWADVTTFDFQAPGFYRKAGYVEYGVKPDYPPGHSNHYLRKDLLTNFHP